MADVAQIPTAATHQVQVICAKSGRVYSFNCYTTPEAVRVGGFRSGRQLASFLFRQLHRRNSCIVLPRTGPLETEP